MNPAAAPGAFAPPASSLRVRLIMGHMPGDIRLLSPGGKLEWDKCRFDLNPEHSDPADFAIVLYNARPRDRFPCALENTLFIAAEPLAKKVYPHRYYQQFYHILDTHTLSQHPRVIETALCLPWHVGLDLKTGSYRFGYDYLATLPDPSKENRISVVCSDAAFTEGQRRRLQFLHALKQRLGDRLVHYGRGFESIADKLDAILPHRLHLALENSESPHYWTEKLTDAYLGWAFPMYVGCPNLEDYFSANSFVRLNPMKPDDAAARIKAKLDAPASAEENAAIAEARRRVLSEYNPFAWCARWAQQLYRPGPRQQLTLRSHKAFRPFPQGWLYRLRGN